MIKTADEHKVKLMTAYKLHFDESNLRAVEIAKSGRLDKRLTLPGRRLTACG
jgi:predicted dehydrogenase